MKRLLKKLTYMVIILSMTLTNNSFCTIYASNSVKYTNENGVVRIYGKGNMPKSMTFRNNKKIKKVIINNKVTRISKRAFYNCKNLKNVKIGNKVKVIGRYACICQPNFRSKGHRKLGHFIYIFTASIVAGCI